jgi:hypothetical protein
MFEDPMFKDALRPVLVTHPLRHPHLYALYVSRKHLPLKIRTFLDHLIERTRVPLPWEESASPEQKRPNNTTTPVVRLVPRK